MFRSRSIATLLVLVLAGCGKVGPPQPPLIRVPQNVTDLAASQDAYNVVLMWTNPPTYIDNNPVEGLTAHILRNGKDIATVPVTAGGKPQSYAVDISDGIGMEQTFAIRFEAERGRAPGFSNVVTVQPADVPGPVVNLGATADQYRIRVSWQPPDRNPELAESYVVLRAGQSPNIVKGTFYDDPDIKLGETYIYTVRAARGPDARLSGPPSAPLPIAAIDETHPQVPSGVVVEPDAVVPGRVFVNWEGNTEADLAGYLVYRSESEGGPWVLRTPMPVQRGFFDNDYIPGMYYGVKAVDFFGNDSPQSSPQRAP